MEQEQIIKALECCPEQGYCGTCPYDNECMGMESLILDALSLIKELTEENERLRADLAKANKDKQILFDEIASLEAEAEKAIDIAEDNIRAEIASGGTSCHWCEDKVRADTVRKMQTEIEKTFSAFCKGEMGDLYRIIDQIAKEMLEDGHR